MVTEVQYSIIKDVVRECIFVKTETEPVKTCQIYLTSPACREENLIQQDETIKTGKHSLF